MRSVIGRGAVQGRGMVEGVGLVQGDSRSLLRVIRTTSELYYCQHWSLGIDHIGWFVSRGCMAAAFFLGHTEFR